ncbi:MAG: phosphoribosylanthranilate isomerase [Thermodesulfobacteriota bacterium]
MDRQRLLVKVCGMTRQEDADACMELGADLLGFILHPPSPRNVAPEQAAAMATPGILRVGVFVRQDADEVRRIMEAARLDLAQLAGNQDPDFCRAVGAGRAVRVFFPERHAGIPELEAELARFAGCMRFALLDAGTSGGGHGRSLAFSSLAGIRSPAPWLLAGGLSPANLSEALSQCSPAGVDINSGVERAPGLKDRAKLEAAFAALRPFR